MGKIKFVNTNLITLKCVLFLFFGAIGSLFPFLPLHMDNTIGFSKDESVFVSIIVPLIAILGPLIAAPLADRLAGGFGGSPRSKTGQYLRVMITVCMVFATIFYWLLLIIPPIIRTPHTVSFYCDEQGGHIIQDSTLSNKSCFDFGSVEASVLLKNCQYTCNSSLTKEYQTTPSPQDALVESDIERRPFSYDEDTTEYNDFYGSGNNPELEPSSLVYQSYPGQTLYNPRPHICYKNASGDHTLCEVYTEESRPLNLLIGLKSGMVEHDEDNDDYLCTYPISGEFSCRIPGSVRANLTNYQDDCHPIITCDILDPYTNRNSLLKITQTINEYSFGLYLFIRSCGDIFTAAAVTLLATAVVIATRETSTGRGDIGKQYAAGALGFGIFAPIIGGVASSVSEANKYKFLDMSLICFTVLILIAVVILLVDRKMPLSPPEWWWHTRCGLLALPMSSVRKYGMEIGALGVVLFLLGMFWNAIDSFLPWHVVHLEERQYLLIGLTITVAAIPAAVFLVFAEKIVDFCGHSNLLIFCFVNYICHHLALMYIEDAGVLLACEWLELFTLHIMYITAVLYLRHLVPRKFTSCGQALPIVAHFCLGRCFGALFGGKAYTEDPKDFHFAHRAFSIAAAVVATLYFIIYHFYMKPKCAAPMHLPPDPAPAVVQSMNGNGAYTPLRVYHNSKSKKGHFRY